MRVHHLNCAAMTPLIVGRIVCHVLLCESTDGLVLVDSGFGSADCADHSRIGPARWLLNARFSEAETAARQLEALGYARSDVRHIVVTHFDLDHVGGLSDFPHATVHTTAVEFDTAQPTADACGATPLPQRPVEPRTEGADLYRQWRAVAGLLHRVSRRRRATACRSCR